MVRRTITTRGFVLVLVGNLLLQSAWSVFVGETWHLLLERVMWTSGAAAWVIAILGLLASLAPVEKATDDEAEDRGDNPNS